MKFNRKWVASKRARMERLESFKKDWLLEVNIDPFIDELTEDPLTDDLKHEEGTRHDRGDYLPIMFWLESFPKKM